MKEREKEILWEKLMGQRTDNNGIEDLFEEGSVCLELWNEICKCEEKILKRLGEEECRELEEMFHCYNEICKIVSLRMFDYGEEKGQK